MVTTGDPQWIGNTQMVGNHIELMYSWHAENHTVEIAECREQMRLSCVQPRINPEYS